MSNNHEKRVPMFCVDTNEIYFMSELVFNDTPFYIEAINSDNYRYIADPIKEFPRLKIFENLNEFDTPEWRDYTKQMRIERVTVKELLDRGILSPGMFAGIQQEDLPDLIADSYLGYYQENKVLNRPTYERLYSYNFLLKCLKKGMVNFFITETTMEEVYKAITEKNRTAIKDFMDLSLVKPIVFNDTKKHSRFLKKVEAALKKYNRSQFINSIHKRGDNDLAIFAESSSLMLDLVSENTTHFISKNRVSEEEDYEISDEFSKLNFENGCFYYSKIKSEKYIAVAPKILTAVDIVKIIKENKKNCESLRGLQETEVTASGIIW